MPIYSRITDKAALDLIDGVRARFHERLKGVKIGPIWAIPKPKADGRPLEPPLKRRGMRILGMVRATSSIERANGGSDVILLLDKSWWDAQIDDDPRRALIDHELTHIEPRINSGGEIARDEHDRFLIDMRLHDYEITGFYEVAERHPASIEIASVNAMLLGYRNHAQLAFQFMNLNQEEHHREEAIS